VWLTGKVSTRDRIKWAGPQLVHCFPVSDQGQSVSVWTHRPWDHLPPAPHDTGSLKVGSSAQKQPTLTLFKHPQTKTVSSSERTTQLHRENSKRTLLCVRQNNSLCALFLIMLQPGFMPVGHGTLGAFSSFWR